jgi:hypothetical protein
MNILRSVLAVSAAALLAPLAAAQAYPDKPMREGGLRLVTLFQLIREG